MYADDTQLYVCFDSLTKADTLKCLENCIADVRSWLMANKLMFNGAKTEIIHFTSRFRRADLLSPLKIESSYLCGVPLLRNLGIFYDNHLSMKAHVNRMCRTSNFQLWKIGQLRKFLDRPTTERLIHAFISSRLDYCNSLLYGLPETEISKLQRVQNSAARLLVGAGKYDSVNGILRTLHWLPVRKRILFKILLLVYKSLNGLAPTYITKLISRYIPTRTLRSGSLCLLNIPQVTTSHRYGDRSFTIAGPREWNKLPIHVKTAPSVGSFKTRLKTYLFNID